MWRLSLRELLVLVALVALAIVSLKYASNELRGVVGPVVLVGFLGSIIAAVMDRGRRQAFAIGMALAMTIYGALLIQARFARGGDKNNEFFVGAGHLPTSSLLSPVYKMISETINVTQNGKVVGQSERPDETIFMDIGHSWWALLLGYVGGRFARFLYVRRTREAEK